MKPIWCCLLMMQIKIENEKKTWFAKDVKQLLEAGMMCTINGDTFFSFKQNMWITFSSLPCHIMNDDTGVFVINNIN